MSHETQGPSRPPGWQTFLADLKRRKVFRVAAVYGGTAFVVLQAAEILADGLQLPPQFLGFLSIAAIAAFPLVLFLAWVYERTPEGLRRTAPADHGELAEIAEQPRARRWPAGLLALAGTILLFTGGWMVLSSAGEAAAGGREEPSAAAPARDRSKIAVLPFTNVSGDAENERLALGVHNDIYTRLTRLRDLRVISRRSVMQYTDASRDLREIADQLDVGAVLTGSAQRAGETLRISVELVDPASSETLWAESYDHEWSVDGLLAIQADIAERVARSLRLTLSRSEERSLAEVPTRVPEAYDYYLKAVEAFDRGFEAENTLVSIERARRAVELDPEFAEAWAMLARAHLYHYWDAGDRTQARLDLATEALDRAVQLAPDLPEVRAVVGYMHYWGHLDYERALEVFEKLEQDAPSTRYVLDGIGSVKRRQGHLAEAAEYFLRAQELDPLQGTWASEAGLTYYLMREYERAISLIEDYVARNPGSGFGHGALARAHLRWTGDTDRAREILNEGFRLRATTPFMEYEAVETELLARRYADALALLDASGEPALGELQFRWVPVELFRGDILTASGDREGAEAAYRAAASVLEAKRDSFPSDERFAGALGLAYAGLGLREEALREVRRGVQLMPVEKEFWRGIHRREELARVYARIGDDESALAELEYLLSRPGEVSAAFVRLDPEWDDLRAEPRFRALVGE